MITTPPTVRLLLFLCALLAAAGVVLAQDGDTPALAFTPLAQTTLVSVVDAPLHLRLVRVRMAGGEAAQSSGHDGMVYQLAGTQTIAVGGRTHTLAPGQGAYVDGGGPATHTASAGEESVSLHFLLVPAAAADLPLASGAADVTELFRSPEALPGLVDGAYTFDLTLLEFPPHYPINDPHYRTGAALYHVLSGSGAFTTEGGTEAKPAGSTIFEPYGLVHQWANPNDGGTVVVVANVSPVDAPAVEFGTP